MKTLVAQTVAEQRRLAALGGYAVLDTGPESDFDDIAVLAAQLCRTPAAAVSLVASERQWLKARVGIGVCETSREVSFCAHAMFGDDVMQVSDARLDARFQDNPLVTGDPGIRFYAGAPLVTAAGEPLGSLCVVDYVPRVLGAHELQSLRTLARHVMAQLELRQYARGLDAANERLRDADRIKDEFLARVTHELRTPLTSINGYLEVLGDEDLGAAGGAGFLERIRRNSDRLMALVDDMLLAAQAGNEGIALHRRPLDLSELAREAVEHNHALAAGRGLTITAEAPDEVVIDADDQRLTQALERLILNAVKFTPRGDIVVRAAAEGDVAVLQVRDTGVGIDHEDQSRVLAPFRRSAVAERDEVQGAGLGLSIVKAIVDSHGGTLTIDSTPGRGTTITIALPRG